MKDRLKEKMREFRNEKIIDTSQFNDPMAQDIEWSPVAAGGTNICTHKLKRITPTRYEFKATISGLFFSWLFVIVGVVIFIVGIKEIIFKDEIESTFKLILLPIMGLIFGGAGLYILLEMTAPRVFDKQIGGYWKGRKTPDFRLAGGGAKKAVMLSDIYSLQIIREFVRGSRSNGRRSSSYFSYELNLVLQDGSRKNVVDHAKYHSLIHEAQELSQFLGKPVWDGSK